MKYAEDNERMGVKEYAVAAALVAGLFMVMWFAQGLGGAI
jgi:hypothetical protein